MINRGEERKTKNNMRWEAEIHWFLVKKSNIGPLTNIKILEVDGGGDVFLQGAKSVLLNGQGALEFYFDYVPSNKNYVANSGLIKMHYFDKLFTIGSVSGIKSAKVHTVNTNVDKYSYNAELLFSTFDSPMTFLSRALSLFGKSILRLGIEENKIGKIDYKAKLVNS